MAPHQHHHSGERKSSASQNLKIAFLLNLSFTVLEIVGGVFTNSVAILSDAVHDAGDCLALGSAWYLQQLSEKIANSKFNYGYRRLSALGALITGVVLIIGLGFVAWESSARLANPEPVYAPGVIGIAIIGIIFNGIAVLRLQGGQSLNEKIASWHLIEDTLGWVAVLIGGVIMTIWDVPIVDPILAILIAIIVLWNVFRNLYRVILIFLQAAPAGFQIKQFHQELLDLPKVVDAHHTYTWSLDGENHVFTSHLVLQPGSHRSEIIETKQRVYGLLKDHNFSHITLEIELQGESCQAGIDPTHDTKDLGPDHPLS